LFSLSWFPPSPLACPAKITPRFGSIVFPQLRQFPRPCRLSFRRFIAGFHHFFYRFLFHKPFNAFFSQPSQLFRREPPRLQGCFFLPPRPNEPILFFSFSICDTSSIASTLRSPFPQLLATPPSPCMPSMLILGAHYLPFLQLVDCPHRDFPCDPNFPDLRFHYRPPEKTCLPTPPFLYFRA